MSASVLPDRSRGWHVMFESTRAGSEFGYFAFIRRVESVLHIDLRWLSETSCRHIWRLMSYTLVETLAGGRLTEHQKEQISDSRNRIADEFASMRMPRPQVGRRNISWEEFIDFMVANASKL